MQLTPVDVVEDVVDVLLDELLAEQAQGGSGPSVVGWAPRCLGDRRRGQAQGRGGGPSRACSRLRTGQAGNVATGVWWCPLVLCPSTDPTLAHVACLARLACLLPTMLTAAELAGACEAIGEEMFTTEFLEAS